MFWLALEDTTQVQFLPWEYWFGEQINNEAGPRGPGRGAGPMGERIEKNDKGTEIRHLDLEKGALCTGSSVITNTGSKIRRSVDICSGLFDRNKRFRLVEGCIPVVILLPGF